MSFPVYEEYSDSGNDWVGTIPSHWDVFPNKVAFRRIKTEVGSDWDSTDLLSLTLRGVVLRDIDSGEGKYPSDFSNYQIVEPGDLVFCLFDMDETPRTVGLSSHRGMITGAYDVFRCTERAEPSYVYYFYRHIDAYKKLRPFYSGLRKTVRTPTFMSIKMPMPPLDEQQAIATFLDRETSKIDALMAEQRRLIELLKEKRQAVISHAVTKGLYPNVPMKNSGIEWLGEVPKHWDVVALKHLVSRQIIDGPHESPEKHDDGIPFVSAESIGRGFIDFDKKWGCISQEDHDRYSQRYKPQRGDILLVKLGATTGVPAIVETDIEFNVWVPLAAIRLKTQFQPRFMFHVLRSNNLRVAYELNWTYGTQQTLGLGTISNLRMPLPPSEERQEIVEYLDSVLPGFDSLEATAERAIDLLQERRTALISAAVTGKIDIRGRAEISREERVSISS